MKIGVRYFAALRDQRGVGHEVLDLDSPTPTSIFESLRAEHSFSLAENQVRYAVNGAYVEGNVLLQAGDELVIVPPVAGG